MFKLFVLLLSVVAAIAQDVECATKCATTAQSCAMACGTDTACAMKCATDAQSCAAACTGTPTDPTVDCANKCASTAQSCASACGTDPACALKCGTDAQSCVAACTGTPTGPPTAAPPAGNDCMTKFNAAYDACGINKLDVTKVVAYGKQCTDECRAAVTAAEPVCTGDFKTGLATFKASLCTDAMFSCICTTPNVFDKDKKFNLDTNKNSCATSVLMGWDRLQKTTCQKGDQGIVNYCCVAPAAAPTAPAAAPTAADSTSAASTLLPVVPVLIYTAFACLFQ